MPLRDYVVVDGDIYELHFLNPILDAMEVSDDLTATSVARMQFNDRQVTVFDVTGTGITSEARRVEVLEPIVPIRKPLSSPRRSAGSLSRSKHCKNRRRLKKRLRKGLHFSDGNPGF